MSRETNTNTQMGLFDTSADHAQKRNGVPGVEKYEGALLLSAIGDALGWPTEFLTPDVKRNPPFQLPVRSFVSWKKRVGGKWWGYIELIEPGQYSDDTQLTLAVARSVSEKCRFEPERFAYEGLPLWLHYERGGGRSIKAAARSLIRRKGDWLHNFYKQNDIDYRNAGANGAAMRNLPIALVHVNDEAALVRDSFFNAVITHGHPRGILGAILFGLAARHVLADRDGQARSTLKEYLIDAISSIGRFMVGDDRVEQWIMSWEKGKAKDKGFFKGLFQQTKEEAQRYLGAVSEFTQKEPREYYRFVGALDQTTKGSGISTVCVAIYLYLQSGKEPATALYTAANMFGSDTDTISVFLGALLGAEHGIQAIPTHLMEQIQDRDYLLKIARRLHAIAKGELYEHAASQKPIDRREAYLRILAWEIGLHEMFWDALDEGSIVVHPTIGRGKITRKDVREIPREGYVAKLIHVAFDCGQTCVFHSRVENNLKVSESLAQDLEKALKE
ncbi:MAG: ADP-ribosylglycohydrolase family protein [Acidobacteria bacterium]|nr:ADP-ribosylglycohydrolase family protein [Acidobacteriota bacterium]